MVLRPSVHSGSENMKPKKVPKNAIWTVSVKADNVSGKTSRFGGKTSETSCPILYAPLKRRGKSVSPT
ncbi:MAG: hypothetical protein QXX57_05030, partial [Nitrososphaerota archaeon]